MDGVDPVEIYRLPMHARRIVRLKDLRIELLHHAEAAKLPLGAVPVAVVVAVFGRQLSPRELVDYLDTGHYLDREWQRRLPAGLGALLVSQVELGGRPVLHA